MEGVNIFEAALTEAASQAAAGFIPWEYWFLAIGAVLASFAAVFFVFKKKQKKESFRMSLDMALLSVKIPQKTVEEIQQSGKQEKDWIRVMEDFYANLVSLKPAHFWSVKPWITLEIAKVRGEICFFVAAPKKYASFVEKRSLVCIRTRRWSAARISIFLVARKKSAAATLRLRGRCTCR